MNRRPGVVVFTGSSVRPDDLDRLRAHARDRGVDLDVRPPIVRRDLADLAGERPDGVRTLILDGEFGQQLSVSVTEIRDFVASGRHLAGASSMGALRAAECHTIGMVAHGWVAARYLDGTVTADDEVALLFDPETLQPVTVPQINVRWLTLGLAAEGRLDAGRAARVLAQSKALHYRARTPAALRRRLADEHPDVVPLLAVGRRDAWDVKRLDALSAVRAEVDAAAVGAPCPSERSAA